MSNSILQDWQQGAPIAWHSITNIKLAAILYTLGFCLRDGMPVSKDIAEGSFSERKSWWFETQAKWGEEDLKAADIAYWYQHKDQFEVEHLDHPITWMRGALDAREWLIKVMHGECGTRPVVVGSVPSYPTRDLKFASSLIAAKFHLLKYDDRTFYFFNDGKIAKHFKAFSEPFDAEAPAAQWPITWMREVLHARDYMARLIQDPRCIPVIRMNFRGRTIILSSQASRETKRDTFRNL